MRVVKHLLKRIPAIVAVIAALSIAVPCVLHVISGEGSTVQAAKDTSGSTISRIREKGVLVVGTAGDYRPLTFLESDGSYWGFDIDLADMLAKDLGVDIRFVKSSWPTLSADVMAVPQLFDLAIGGITITDKRLETMLMSVGYLANGKTILCRVTDVDRFRTIDDIDKPEVKVMVNPGGTNELFANERLSHSSIAVHQRNEEIPSLIAGGAADIMITEVTEAPYYVRSDERLAAPLVDEPFTTGNIGILMQKGQEDLLDYVNTFLDRISEDGRLRGLCEKYSLVYSAHR